MACVNHPENPYTQKCSRCGRDFCNSCLVEIKDNILCGACKKDYLRDIQSGTVGQYHFAGFWIRFLAFFVDSIVLNIIYQPIQIVVNFTIGPASGNTPGPYFFLATLGLMAFNMTLNMAYYTFLHGKYGQTLGKMACRIKVINQDGTSISYLKAFGRYWGFFLSSIILQIGNIMAGFDDEKKALHDRLCETYVIYKND
ncbi:MAG: RDD family protein [Candidatus Aureabacteria bacterium]|nr:RDD family protein [Candidatus Auribacterota bacterium]